MQNQVTHAIIYAKNPWKVLRRNNYAMLSRVSISHPIIDNLQHLNRGAWKISHLCNTQFSLNSSFWKIVHTPIWLSSILLQRLQRDYNKNERYSHLSFRPSHNCFIFFVFCSIPLASLNFIAESHGNDCSKRIQLENNKTAFNKRRLIIHSQRDNISCFLLNAQRDTQHTIHYVAVPYENSL